MSNLSEFKSTLSDPAPPAEASIYLKAMWLDAKGQWDAAHHLVDDVGDEQACWVHAYLHRKEGDMGNADYWYRHAGKKRPATTLHEEWDEIVSALL